MASSEQRAALRATAADAHLLIQEIAKSGRAFDASKVKPIFDAASAGDDELDGLDEAKFWEAVGYVSEAAKPHRIDTIRQLIDLRSPFRISPINIYIFCLSLIAVGILAASLAFVSEAADIQDKLGRFEKLVERNALVATDSAEKARNKADMSMISYSLYLRDEARFRTAAPVLVPGKSSYEEADMFKLVTEHEQMQGFVRSQSKDHLQFIQFYWLPVLLALLGAAVSILRRTYVSVETASVDILSTSMVALRLTTAAIAGIAIGWVYKSTGADQTVAVTPFVLAFVAGYSVDVLFTLLDRISQALSDRPATK